MEANSDHLIAIKMDKVPDYTCTLRLGGGAPGPNKMTALLYAIDFVKEQTGVSQMENTTIRLHFDADNRTTPEEVLNTRMEELIIFRDGAENPFSDKYLQPEQDDKLYLNDKSQLLRLVTKITDTGKTKELHNILSFDVAKLPHANFHQYVGEESFQE